MRYIYIYIWRKTNYIVNYILKYGQFRRCLTMFYKIFYNFVVQNVVETWIKKYNGKMAVDILREKLHLVPLISAGSFFRKSNIPRNLHRKERERKKILPRECRGQILFCRPKLKDRLSLFRVSGTSLIPIPVYFSSFLLAFREEVNAFTPILSSPLTRNSL